MPPVHLVLTSCDARCLISSGQHPVTAALPRLRPAGLCPGAQSRVLRAPGAYPPAPSPSTRPALDSERTREGGRDGGKQMKIGIMSPLQSEFHNGSPRCVVQPLSRVRLFATPWTSACQDSLSIIISQSLLKLMSMESMMPSNHRILCHRLLLLPAIFPSIRVFSNESALHIT